MRRALLLAVSVIASLAACEDPQIVAVRIHGAGGGSSATAAGIGGENAASGAGASTNGGDGSASGRPDAGNGAVSSNRGGAGNDAGAGGAAEAGAGALACAASKVAARAACAGTLELGSMPSLHTGGSPRGLTVADFDGDKNLDVGVADEGIDGVAVLLGNGDGTFQPTINTLTSAGADPQAIATGFFDADKNLDVVTADFGPSTVSVLLGNGDGHFKPAKSYSVGFKPRAVAVGLLNNDASGDVVVANYSGNSLSVLISKGDGTFNSPATLFGPSNPNALAIADLNGDQINDLAVGNLYGITVLIGKGDGTFPGSTKSYLINFPSSIALGHFDADDKLDVAATINGSPAPTAVSVMLGNGDGSFQAAQSYPAGENPQSVAVTDFDADGFDDLVVANGFANNQPGYSVSVLLSNGDGTFQSPIDYLTGRMPVAVAVADFDHDSHADVIVGNNSLSSGYSSYDIDVLRGVAADGGLSAPRFLPTASGPEQLASADLNHDCLPDFVVAANLGKAVSVLLAKPGGGYEPAAKYDLGTTPFDVVVGDFTGDGELDLQVTTASGVSRLVGVGDGTFANAVSIFGGSTVISLVSGDFNGDGKLDTAMDSSVGATAGCFRVNLGGTATWTSCNATTDYPRKLAVGDVNGDTKLDLVAIENQKIGVFWGNGDGSFQPEAPYGGINGAGGIALGDLDGDEDLDVATTGNDNIAVFLNAGDGTFGAPKFYPAQGFASSYLALADLDGDGSLDIASTKRLSNIVGVLRNKGDGSFGPELTYPTGTDPYGLIAGDFDLDGAPDIAVAAYTGNSLTLLSNVACVP